MPGSFSLRHAYLATDTAPRMMRNPIDLYVVAASSSQRRETDCSGRSLATLLVAWVSAAMIASVLLRWKYMWIALAVLTLLFLIACGYAACTTRRALQRQMLTEEAAYMDQRRMEVQSVSGNLACPERAEPPAYQTYWITDLPPPYAVVIGTEVPPPAEERVSLGPRSSDPPPYSAVVQDHATTPLDQSLSPTISHVTPRDPTTSITINDDKDTPEQSRGHSHVLSAQYLSNFITRFGRGRSRNLEQNSRDESHLRNQGNQGTSDCSSRPDHNTF